MISFAPLKFHEIFEGTGGVLIVVIWDVIKKKGLTHCVGPFSLAVMQTLAGGKACLCEDQKEKNKFCLGLPWRGVDKLEGKKEGPIHFSIVDLHSHKHLLYPKLCFS